MPSKTAFALLPRRGGAFCAAALALLTGALPRTAAAEVVYQEPKAFIADVFENSPPEPSLLRIIGERRKTAGEILGHPPPMLRVRYWQKHSKSAWILEEIGKTQPITAGFIVESGQLQDVRILIYRESRGDEVRHDFFTDQFKEVSLDERRKLSRSIDGISGATMSVSAIRRLAGLALFLAGEAKKERAASKQ